jgi:sulfide:quinone oxidoreductase
VDYDPLICGVVDDTDLIGKNMEVLCEDFVVCPQISPEDIPALKEQGFATIFCHRPDQEDQGEPSFEVIQNRAKTEGLSAKQLAVVPGQLTEQDFANFRKLYHAAPKPILAYCKSGARAKMLWQRLAG